MTASFHQILAAAAALSFILFGVLRSTDASPWQNMWRVPALLAILFAGFSIYAVVSGGPLGFWQEHIRNGWGNQIWFDLLLAGGLSFAMLAPRARAVGMTPLPWFVLIACTGSIGILAMTARCLFLERRTG